jgi:hypothetical protein
LQRIATEGDVASIAVVKKERTAWESPVGTVERIVDLIERAAQGRSRF